MLVALGLDQHIQNLALGVDGPPQVNHAPIDFQIDLVKMPDRMRSGTALAQMRGDHRSKVVHDDWSWRKGRTYGTIIIDLERREVVDVLADRTTTGTAQWLGQHPEVEIVSRDRCGLYAQGAHEGAPQARQVADRFHLLQNLRETIETQLSRADRSTGRKRAKSPLSAPPPRSTRFGSPLVLSRVHWVEPKLVAEITFLTWTADNLLRQTVYVGLREDKPAEQVRREQKG